MFFRVTSLCGSLVAGYQRFRASYRLHLQTMAVLVSFLGWGESESTNWPIVSAPDDR
jgi:hypothetical protein